MASTTGFDCFLDEELEKLDLWRQLVPRDGACLFRCLSEALYEVQQYWPLVRSECLMQLSELGANAVQLVPMPLSLDQFVKQISASTCCTSHPNLMCLLGIACSAFGCCITVYSVSQTPSGAGRRSLQIQKLQPPQSRPSIVTDIALACSGSGHYDLVLTRSRCSSLAICQSVVFQLLMSEVFRVPDAAELCKDRFDAAATAGRCRRSQRRQLAWLLRQKKQQQPEDQVQEQKTVPDGADVEIEPLPTSFRAVKAMSPCIYRNIQFDLWRSGDQPDLRTGALLLADGCRVAYLKQVCPDASSCIVYPPQEPDSTNSASRCVQLPSNLANSTALTPAAAATSTPSRPAVARLRLALGLKADVHWRDRTGAVSVSDCSGEICFAPVVSNSSSNKFGTNICRPPDKLNNSAAQIQKPVAVAAAGLPPLHRLLKPHQPPILSLPASQPIRWHRFSLPSFLASLAMAPIPLPNPMLPAMPIQLDAGFSCCPLASDLLCLSPLTVVFFYNLGVQTRYCLQNLESFYTMESTAAVGSATVCSCCQSGIRNVADQNNNNSNNSSNGGGGGGPMGSESHLFNLLLQPPFVNLWDPAIDYAAGFSLCQLATDLRWRSPSTLRFFYNSGLQAFRTLNLIDVFLCLNRNGVNPASQPLCGFIPAAQ